jgi:hypothetical protein
VVELVTISFPVRVRETGGVVDWTSAIGAASAAVVGVTGIVATYRAGRRQQVTALEVARMQVESHERIVREERHQQRLEKVYDSLLTALNDDERTSSLSLPQDLLHIGAHGVVGSQPSLVVLSACLSGPVDELHQAWRSESDPERRKSLAGQIRAQVRRELVGVDHELSLAPYAQHDDPESPTG